MLTKKKYYTFYNLIFTILISFGTPSQWKKSTHQNWNLEEMDMLSKEYPNKSYLYAKKKYLFSLKTKNELENAESLYILGKSVGNMHKYSEALKYLEYARIVADKLHHEPLLVYIDFAVAVQYGRLNFNQKAIDLINLCFKKTDVIPNEDTRNQLIANLYSFKAFFLAGIKPEPSYWVLLNYHKKAAFYLNKIRNRKYPNFAYTNIGLYYELLKKYDIALYYYKKSLDDSKIKHSTTLEIVYHNIANIYFTKGEYQKSIIYLDSSISLSKPKKIYYMLKDSYGLLKKNYEQLGNTSLKNYYTSFESAYNDSLNSVEKEEYIKGTNLILKKLEVEKLNNDRENLVLIFVSTGISLLLLILFIIYVKKQKLKVQQKDNNITSQTKEIVELKQKVTTTYQEVIEMAKKDNPLFISLFKELYPDFYGKLLAAQPKLTITEQKVCFFIKLKFSTKEIATYTYVSSKAIQNRKNRLRKRLGLKNAEDLYEWIENL